MYITSYDCHHNVQSTPQTVKPKLCFNSRQMFSKNLFVKKKIVPQINDTSLETYNQFQQRQRQKKQMNYQKKDNKFVAVYCLDYRAVKQKLQQQKQTQYPITQNRSLRRALSANNPPETTLPPHKTPKKHSFPKSQIKQKQTKQIRIHRGYTKIGRGKSCEQKDGRIVGGELQKNDENKAQVRYKMRQKHIGLEIENIDPWPVRSYFQDDVKFV